MTFDFDSFLVDFRSASLDALRALIHNHNEHPFYALCVYCDGFDGVFILYANTEQAFKETLAEYQRKWPDSYSDAERTSGLKYNCGDFDYCTFDPKFAEFSKPFDEKMRRWESLVRELSHNQDAFSEDDWRRFDEIGCEVAISLSNSEVLGQLLRTPDFVMMVADHDEPSLAAIQRYDWYAKHGSLLGFDAFA